VDGVLNFQLDEGAAADVCAAYGDLPTVGVEIHQTGCEAVHVGRDVHRAGEVVGIAMAEHLRDETGCSFEALVLLEPDGTEGITDIQSDRVLEGFATVCSTPAADAVRRLHPTEDSADAALTTVGAALADMPLGGVIAVFAPNDDEATGVLRAFEDAGRGDELRLAAQGAEDTVRGEIACDPRWIADAGYWPEKLGRILVPAMLDLLDGRPLPASLPIPHSAIDANNVREQYPDTPACP
jgi:ABC-type sugar transport system substrate-binding protein